MKKITLIGLVCIFSLFLVMTAQAADVNPGTFVSGTDFTTHFWKEKFFGGGHGQVGNVLMASGNSFSFNNVMLSERPNVIFASFSTGCGSSTVGYYLTPYLDGTLTLNSKGPWLESGKLKMNIESATNRSGYDSSTGMRMFELEFEGFDLTGDYYIEVRIWWCETADNYDENAVFQRGYGFNAEIIITDTAGP